MTKVKEAPTPVILKRKTKYNFREMEVGDEFLTEEQTQEGAQKVTRAAWQFCFKNKKLKMKFSVNLYTDGKYRCKRVK